MLVFAGVQKILLQTTRDRLMCTLKTRTGSREVVKFNKKEYVEKVTEEKNGILLCKSRIMDGQRFITTAGFDLDNLGGEVQLNMRTLCCRTSRGSQTGPC